MYVSAHRYALSHNTYSRYEVITLSNTLIQSNPIQELIKRQYFKFYPVPRAENTRYATTTYVSVCASYPVIIILQAVS